MKFQHVTDKITVKDRTLLLTYLFRIKFDEIGIHISENNIKVLTLFLHNSNKSEVVKKSLELNYVRSIQSGENAVTELVNNGLLEKTAIGVRNVSKLVPKISGDYILAEIQLVNASI